MNEIITNGLYLLLAEVSWAGATRTRSCGKMMVKAVPCGGTVRLWRTTKTSYEVIREGRECGRLRSSSRDKVRGLTAGVHFLPSPHAAWPLPLTTALSPLSPPRLALSEDFKFKLKGPRVRAGGGGAGGAVLKNGGSAGLTSLFFLALSVSRYFIFSLSSKSHSSQGWSREWLIEGEDTNGPRWTAKCHILLGLRVRLECDNPWNESLRSSICVWRMKTEKCREHSNFQRDLI